MNQILRFSWLGLLCCCSSISLANTTSFSPVLDFSHPEFYIGIEGGRGETNWEKLGTTTIGNDYGYTVRPFIGIDLNKYLAVELGYINFSNKARITAGTGTNFTAKTEALDLVGKFKLPITQETAFYTKLGINYLMHTFDGTYPDYGVDGPTTIKNNVSKIVFGAGFDCAITKHIITNIEWVIYHGNTSSNIEVQPSAIAIMMGLRYKF